jgi:F0F1-type ATP synthase membrane subunit b/b'
MYFLKKNDISNNLVLFLSIFILILFLLYYFLTKKFQYRYGNKKNIEGIKNLGKKLKKSTKNIGKDTKNLGKSVTPKAMDIGKVIKDVQKIGNSANKLGKEVGSLGKKVGDGLKTIEKTTTKAIDQIDEKLKKIQKTIMEQTEKLVLDKIGKIFTGLGKVLYDAIVAPLRTLFAGLGNIIMQIFEILKQIGYKIVSLPGCILFYLINGTVSSILGIISAFIPSWIEKPIASIWNATFGKLIDWFLGVVGYKSASKKCYGFDVNEEIDKMNKSFKKIGDSFTKDFGRFDFKSIKI